MKTLTLAAALLAVAASASAELNSSGNFVTDSKAIIIVNPDSSYEQGDVIFKRGSTDPVTIEGTTYSEIVGFNTVIGINEADNTGRFVKFDHNGNAVIGDSCPSSSNGIPNC